MAISPENRTPKHLPAHKNGVSKTRIRPVAAADFRRKARFFHANRTFLAAKKKCNSAEMSSKRLNLSEVQKIMIKNQMKNRKNKNRQIRASNPEKPRPNTTRYI